VEMIGKIDAIWSIVNLKIASLGNYLGVTAIIIIKRVKNISMKIEISILA
jgi:hypothetical protein